MKTLLLTDVDLRRLVRSVGVDVLMEELIGRLESAFRLRDEQTETPVRTGFQYDAPVDGLVEWMPVMRRGRQVLMKVVGYHPDNPTSHGIPTVLSTLCAYDTATGHLASVVDGTLLTAMRTGAASAVASRWMARPDSRRLGLIGCGAQAVTQLHALGRLFSFDEIWIQDTDPAALDSFPERVAGFVRREARIRVAPAEEIVRGADIVSVATSIAVGRGPVFEPVETKPWLHVNAVGSDFPGKTELPKSLLEQSFVCADTLDQARIEGECQQLDPDAIHAEIVDVVREAHEASALRLARTVFDSTGWALEDQVAMDLALERARELGIGSEVTIECFDEDPRHPYGFLADATVLRMPVPREADHDSPRQTGNRSSG